jgi:hypothetical protein
MDLTVQRRSKRSDGIFSEVGRTDTGETQFVTLEHAYTSEQGFEPKVPPGTYLCQRGGHKLHDGVPFETFEVTGVVGHSGILFHHGNWNDNSDGCLLTGTDFAQGSEGGRPATEMVISSDVAFAKFMQLQEGCDTFQLTVVDCD